MLPQPMRAERHQIVHDVVLAGHRREDRAHARRPCRPQRSFQSQNRPCDRSRSWRPLQMEARHCSRLGAPASSASRGFRGPFGLRRSARGSAPSSPARSRAQFVQQRPTNTDRCCGRRRRTGAARSCPTGSTPLMPTSSLPVTSTPSPPPWPFTSAEGENTRRYSNGNSKCEPSSKRTSSSATRCAA